MNPEYITESVNFWEIAATIGLVVAGVLVTIGGIMVLLWVDDWHDRRKY